MTALTMNRPLPERMPEVGEVQVRSRRWLVEEVVQSTPPGNTSLVRLACADDDAQGQSLEVFWDYELDRRILEEEGWQDLAAKGFDAPRQFAAFLHTLRFEHRLFLSATPHNGHSNSFSTLLELLDPYRFTRGVKVRGKRALEDIMVRRLKEDIREVQGGSPRWRTAAKGFSFSFARRP